MSDASARPSTCPVCARPDASVFAELSALPVHCNLLWPTREAAVSAPCADIALACCHGCGHVFNVLFDPERMRYTAGYENALDFSPTFQDYAAALARDLADHHVRTGATVVDVGCGQGEFLAQVCAAARSRGFGFDPGRCQPRATIDGGLGVTLIADVYSQRYAELTPDLVTCRHVLEHSEDPHAFLTAVRAGCDPHGGTTVFFEVPNAIATLRDLAVWDVIYEHCGYFNAYSLARLFIECDFDVEAAGTAFDGQFLCLKARPGDGRISNELEPALDESRSIALAETRRFADRYQRKVEEWRTTLDDIAASGKRAVVWGAGSKGVTFLNTLDLGGAIDHAVDINPRKTGMFVAGSGQSIVAPEELSRVRPDVVLVMNAIYRDEIARTTRDLGVRAELLAV